MQSSRRQFVIASACLASSLALPNFARAADLAESDPKAQALGYTADATKANKAKFTNYVAGSRCGTCALFQGKAGAAKGPCLLFQGADVNAQGWCSGYSKKT
jgi:hypothetical protein